LPTTQEQTRDNNTCPIKQFFVRMPIELAASGAGPRPEAFVFAQATVSTSATGNQRKVAPSSFSALTVLHGGARPSNESFDRNRTVVSCDARPDFRRSRQRDSSSRGNSPLWWPRTGQCGEMRCRHQQPSGYLPPCNLCTFMALGMRALAVRGGLSGVDRLSCFARRRLDQNHGRRRQFARPPGFPMISRSVRQDGAKRLFPSLGHCPCHCPSCPHQWHRYFS
jgi:hypothetical protein